MNIYDMLSQQGQQPPPFARLMQDSNPMMLPYSQSGVQTQINQSVTGPSLRAGLNSFGANQGVAWNSPARVADATYRMGAASASNLANAANIRSSADQANAGQALSVNQALNNEMSGLYGLNQNAYQFNQSFGRQQQGNLLQMLSPFFSAMQDYSGF